MVKPVITCRPYREGDEKGINELFNRIFSRQRPLKEWNWKFRDNPAVIDPSHWIAVLERDKVIVGHYASMPVDMVCGARVITVSQGVDTMIDPSARMGIKTLRDLCRKGVELASQHALFGFGFPNDISCKVGGKLLGYKDIGRMEQFCKRLSIREAIKRRIPALPQSLLWPAHKISQVIYSPTLTKGRYTIEEASEFDSSVDKLWDEVKGKFRITAIRKSKYLNWRYRDRGYTILIVSDDEDVAGYAVLKMDASYGHKVGYIIDMLSKKDTAGLVINRALQVFIQRDAEYCLCAMAAGSPMAEYLRNAGFEGDKGFESFPVILVPFPNIYVGKTQEEDKVFLMNLDNWHLTYGDTDGF